LLPLAFLGLFLMAEIIQIGMSLALVALPIRSERITIMKLLTAALPPFAFVAASSLIPVRHRKVAAGFLLSLVLIVQMILVLLAINDTTNGVMFWLSRPISAAAAAAAYLRVTRRSSLMS
jgi:hypothetical protein